MANCWWHQTVLRSSGSVTSQGPSMRPGQDRRGLMDVCQSPLAPLSGKGWNPWNPATCSPVSSDLRALHGHWPPWHCSPAHPVVSHRQPQCSPFKMTQPWPLHPHPAPSSPARRRDTLGRALGMVLPEPVVTSCLKMLPLACTGAPATEIAIKYK